ncbi:MAG: S-layer homology domain-containing protein [Clostridiales bacterium]|nr:S-layer homology domain-containing protein [Clostridiales bacterium]
MGRMVKTIVSTALAAILGMCAFLAVSGTDARAAAEVELGREYVYSLNTSEYNTYTFDLHIAAGRGGYYLFEADGDDLNLEFDLYCNGEETPVVTRTGSEIFYYEDLQPSTSYSFVVKGKAKYTYDNELRIMVSYIDPQSPDVVTVNDKTFPDPIFRNYVLTRIDIDGDMTLSEAEIFRVREIYFKSDESDDSTKYYDLTGIKFFKELRTLYYDNNYLTSLDVSGLDKLERLSVIWGKNDLRSVNCSGCSSLKTLELQANDKLSDLNFKGCNKIEIFNLNGSSVPSIDVASLPELRELRCGKNRVIKSIDLSHNPELVRLYIQDTGITGLDLTNNTKLYEINVAEYEEKEGSISYIKFGYQPNLKTINCYRQSLTDLDISSCPKLTSIQCGKNKLTSLDCSNNPKLQSLSCKDNKIGTVYAAGAISDLNTDPGVEVVILSPSDWQFTGYGWDVDNADPSKTVAYANFKCTKAGHTSHTSSQIMKLKILVLDPTCDETGLIEYLASLPDSVSRNRESLSDKKSFESPAKGHDWGAWKVTTKATVGKNGEETRICKNDSSHKQTRKIAALTPTPTAKPTKAASVTLKLDKSKADIVCGKTLTLKATVKGTKQTVTWKSSDTKVATVDKNGKVKAKMAGAVTVTATVAGKTATCKVTVLYKDVTNSKDFWFEPTNYLTAKGVVKGYDNQTKFKPANICTRAQMVTFIWRLKGEPKPKTSKCKFSDVKKTDYFYKACIWGNENHIVEGYKDGTFGPQIVCARRHAVTFLWRLAGTPKPSSSKNKFKDVKKSDYFYTATLWASEKKILAGYDDGTFRPNGNCLRRQMVTFLYKYDKFVNGKG